VKENLEKRTNHRSQEEKLTFHLLTFLKSDEKREKRRKGFFSFVFVLFFKKKILSDVMKRMALNKNIYNIRGAPYTTAEKTALFLCFSAAAVYLL
jgi:hypothetical protein